MNSKLEIELTYTVWLKFLKGKAKCSLVVISEKKEADKVLSIASKKIEAAKAINEWLANVSYNE